MHRRFCYLYLPVQTHSRLRMLAESHAATQNQSEALQYQHCFPSTAACSEGAEVTPLHRAPTHQHWLQFHCIQH